MRWKVNRYGPTTIKWNSEGGHDSTRDPTAAFVDWKFGCITCSAIEREVYSSPVLIRTWRDEFDSLGAQHRLNWWCTATEASIYFSDCFARNVNKWLVAWYASTFSLSWSACFTCVFSVIIRLTLEQGWAIQSFKGLIQSGFSFLLGRQPLSPSLIYLVQRKTRTRRSPWRTGLPRPAFERCSCYLYHVDFSETLAFSGPTGQQPPIKPTTSIKPVWRDACPSARKRSVYSLLRPAVAGELLGSILGISQILKIRFGRRSTAPM